ncbi:hypothetical protein MADA3029_510119 [Vibrio nigripulchritudo MADA3029]|nr:hypothetical protein VIBNIMADA3020_750118 [Vibrio nigripulchritudo MADA3020]CCN51396.1 hypothetical protein VIBNIMADA3021_1040119 [Vibrio nigripulchritudo MADA3021]CCN60031.1 hypothetical protein MADA3029_510119 [Vibrio nigripulchritudo MADA3029]
MRVCIVLKKLKERFFIRMEMFILPLIEHVKAGARLIGQLRQTKIVHLACY